MRKPGLALLLALLMPFTASATLVNSDKNGFAIEIEQSVPTSAAKAYQRFLQVGSWWHPDHTWFGISNNLTIEPKAGGCFCELAGEKQALHMLVTYVDPGKELRMQGGLGPLQMMGAQGGMSWQFIDLDQTHAKIVMEYNVVGYSKEGMDQIAPVVDKVLTLQVSRLANSLKHK